MKTTVKEECRNSRTVYRLNELDNFPPELPELIKAAGCRLRECPCCGKETAWIHYNFTIDYCRVGEPQSAHIFTAVCTGQSREANINSSCSTPCVFGACCIQTSTVPNITDNVDNLKETLEYVVSWWNKRPDAPARTLGCK